MEAEESELIRFFSFFCCLVDFSICLKEDRCNYDVYRPRIDVRIFLQTKSPY